MLQVPGRLAAWLRRRERNVVHGSAVVPVTAVYYIMRQAKGLDAWASRVKCPARFVSHLHEICIYIYMSC